MIDLREIEGRVGAFIGQIDRAIAKSLGDSPVSCSKGCAHCCYLTIEIGVGEALWIAAEVARWPDWREMARALYAHAAEQTVARSWKAEWFERHIPCPFLTTDNLCRIYERRPVACRAHLVKSPPENCALGAANPVTALYDSYIQCIPYVQWFDADLFIDYPAELGRPFVGLFTHLVLWALQFYVRGGDRRWLDKRLSKLPTPREWTRRSVSEQLVQLGPRSMMEREP